MSNNGTGEQIMDNEVMQKLVDEIKEVALTRSRRLPPRRRRSRTR